VVSYSHPKIIHQNKAPNTEDAFEYAERCKKDETRENPECVARVVRAESSRKPKPAMSVEVPIRSNISNTGGLQILELIERWSDRHNQCSVCWQKNLEDVRSS
jgi:hypothetical protein